MPETLRDGLASQDERRCHNPDLAVLALQSVEMPSMQRWHTPYPELSFACDSRGVGDVLAHCLASARKHLCSCS